MWVPDPAGAEGPAGAGAPAVGQLGMMTEKAAIVVDRETHAGQPVQPGQPDQAAHLAVLKTGLMELQVAAAVPLATDVMSRSVPDLAAQGALVARQARPSTRAV